MRLASFDLGRRNFAVFILDVNPHTLRTVRSYKDCARSVAADTETEIVHWENRALPDLKEVGGSIPELVRCMSAHVRSQWALFGSADCVVIEQQLLRNPAMKCAAHALQAIFAFHEIRVELLPAKSKFKAFPGAITGKERSPQLKKAAIATMRLWLVSYQGRSAAEANQALAAVIGDDTVGSAKRKLDDLCDAGLQGLSALYLFRNDDSRRQSPLLATSMTSPSSSEAAAAKQQ